MNMMTENAATEAEQSVWYNDSRVWLLAVAAAMFFFTMLSESQERRTRRTVSVPATFLSSPTVSRDIPTNL